MQRIKILVWSALVVIVLCVLSMSGLNPDTAIESESGNTDEKEASALLTIKFAKQYRQQQKALRLALNSYFEKAIASGQIIGAGVSVVRGDSIVFSGGFGQRQSNSGKKVNGETIFRLGSLSKGFTGILAAQLEEEGAVDWDQKVSDCIPEFKLGTGLHSASITLANLLSHSTGAPYHSYTNLIEAGLPLMDITRRFQSVEPISEPGGMYSYQNALFAISGELMTKASGQSFPEAMDARFFGPLGMCTTTMDHNTLLEAENVAIPHVRRRRGWRPLKLKNSYYNAIPAGGINASAEDMGKWMRFLLGHNPEVMQQSVIQKAFTPFIEIPGRSKYYQRWPGHQESHYGFGWRIHTYAKEEGAPVQTIWHHGGSVNNYRNEIAMYPDEDLGICVLFNSNTRLSGKVIPDLYKLVQQVYGERAPQLVSNR